MDTNLPMEAMIWDMEDVQRFLLSNLAKKMELTDAQLFTHGLIKLSKTGGLCGKAVEQWNKMDLLVHQQWMKFKTPSVDEYEKMLATGGGTTIG